MTPNMGFDFQGTAPALLKSYQVYVLFFHLFEKKVFSVAAVLYYFQFNSEIVTCETRLTENGISPQSNLCMVSSINY